MWDEVQQGVAAQRAHGQRHQEAEQELEEDLPHERHEDDAEQREQADDGDGDEAAQPGCRRTQSPASLPARRKMLRKRRRLTDADAPAALSRVLAVVMVRLVAVVTVTMSVV